MVDMVGEFPQDVASMLECEIAEYIPSYIRDRQAGFTLETWAERVIDKAASIELLEKVEMIFLKKIFEFQTL